MKTTSADATLLFEAKWFSDEPCSSVHGVGQGMVGAVSFFGFSLI